jgi:hypothetical protein
MKPAWTVVLIVCAAGIYILGGLHVGAAAGHERAGEKQARVRTDGRLRPGHLEKIRVVGFPGRGRIEVSLFPTAICEDECSARSFRGGWSNAAGAASFQVRMPGTFFDYREHPVYFRDGERIDVNVTWEGPGNSFDVASADPQPVIVRTHGSRRG